MIKKCSKVLVALLLTSFSACVNRFEQQRPYLESLDLPMPSDHCLIDKNNDLDKALMLFREKEFQGSRHNYIKQSLPCHEKATFYKDFKAIFSEEMYWQYLSPLPKSMIGNSRSWVVEEIWKANNDNMQQQQVLNKSVYEEIQNYRGYGLTATAEKLEIIKKNNAIYYYFLLKIKIGNYEKTQAGAFAITKVHNYIVSNGIIIFAAGLNNEELKIYALDKLETNIQKATNVNW